MSINSLALTLPNLTYIIVEILIGLCAIIGNMLVIWVVKLNPSLQTTTFYFIVSLALADIAVGVLVMPLAVVISLGIIIHFYNCLFMTCLLLIFTHASIMSLLAIAVDRYLRVKLTVRYKRVTTQRRIWLALGLCWLVSFVVGLTPLFGWNMKLISGYKNVTYIPCQFRSVMRMDYMVYFSFFTWILIPLIVMCAIYLDIFYIIRNKLNQNVSGSKETGAFYGREFKTAKSLFLVLFLFAASWLPLSIINCIIYFNGEVPEVVLYLGILLSHANSMMNPIVYAYKIKKFKETYLLIFKTCMICQSSQSLDPSSEQNAMVMDEKFKERSVLGTASAVCSYDAHYKGYPKYWCRGYFRYYCKIIALTPNSTGRVALKDTGKQLIVTVSCLTKEDSGWYWCGVQRNFARDDMDFTELMVTNNSEALVDDVWSEKDLQGTKKRSWRTSKIVQKADLSRMSILIICTLITSSGIISIACHLFKRGKSQRNRRGK
ncbi:adenosine receptor A3 [Rhynchocyon petersi]